MPQPVPIHLISGFLGSGKTTLLLRFLAEQPSEERLVVLVNEFGSLGIDGSLLNEFSSEVRELTSGCICCILKPDFINSLTDLIQRFEPHRIAVEATGLAETGVLSEAIQELGRREDVYLASVATVVDAEIFTNREIMGPLFFNQIKDADLLLLNKTDLVPSDSIADLIEELARLNTKARIMPVVHCAVDRETMIAPLRSPSIPGNGSILEAMPDLAQNPGPDSDHDDHDDEDHHHDHDQFLSFNYESDRILDAERLDAFLGTLPWELFRLKGFVNRADGRWLLNYTYRRPEFTPVSEPGPNRLVFIGWDLEPSGILERLGTCERS